MTLAEFQPYVEQAITAYEWASAQARHQREVLANRESILGALRYLDERESIGVEVAAAAREMIDRDECIARLAQLDLELQREVNAGEVPALPLRSVPMDLITAAVVRRCLRLPAEFPVLSIKTLPTTEAIADAVAAIAMKWQTPNGASAEEPTRIASHV